jgi:hypothetical protein
MISHGSSIERANVVETHIAQRHRKFPSFDPGGRRGLCTGFRLVESDSVAIVQVGNKVCV